MVSHNKHTFESLKGTHAERNLDLEDLLTLLDSLVDDVREAHEAALDDNAEMRRIGAETTNITDQMIYKAWSARALGRAYGLSEALGIIRKYCQILIPEMQARLKQPGSRDNGSQD